MTAAANNGTGQAVARTARPSVATGEAGVTGPVCSAVGPRATGVPLCAPQAKDTGPTSRTMFTWATGSSLHPWGVCAATIVKRKVSVPWPLIPA